MFKIRLVVGAERLSIRMSILIQCVVITYYTHGEAAILFSKDSEQLFLDYKIISLRF